MGSTDDDVLAIGSDSRGTEESIWHALGQYCRTVLRTVDQFTGKSQLLREMGDADEAVAQRLKKVRLLLGMSKRAFAERAGMTEQAYNPFENSRRPLSLIAAKKLRQTYDLSLDFIYFGDPSGLPHRIAKEL